MTQAPDDEIRAVWEALAKDVNAWPPGTVVSTEVFESLLPVYKAAGAVQGKIDLKQVIEARYAEQALKSLGQR
jgi:NitT/TauT family transport system substrate-binding protein